MPVTGKNSGRQTGTVEAAPEEKPFATTEDFDRLYQRVKLSLFRSDTKNRNDKNILKAIQKINAIKVKLPEDYYSDLLAALDAEALSGYEVRFINQVKRAESQNYSKRYLPTILCACSKCKPKSARVTKH